MFGSRAVRILTDIRKRLRHQSLVAIRGGVPELRFTPKENVLKITLGWCRHRDDITGHGLFCSKAVQKIADCTRGRQRGVLTTLCGINTFLDGSPQPRELCLFFLFALFQHT